jgi:hypothetical protein
MLAIAVATYVLGVAFLIVLTFWLTRTPRLSRGARASLRALVVAMAFTPSIILGGHGGVFPVPAFVALAAALSPRSGGWIFALLFGVFPISVAWAALRLWWPGLGDPD